MTSLTMCVTLCCTLFQSPTEFTYQDELQLIYTRETCAIQHPRTPCLTKLVKDERGEFKAYCGKNNKKK